MRLAAGEEQSLARGGIRRTASESTGANSVGKPVKRQARPPLPLRYKPVSAPA